MSKVQLVVLYSTLFLMLGFFFAWLSYRNYLLRKTGKIDLINYIFTFFTEFGFGPAAILCFIISSVGFISLFSLSL